jgi:hypothetical protein
MEIYKTQIYVQREGHTEAKEKKKVRPSLSTSLSRSLMAVYREETYT